MLMCVSRSVQMQTIQTTLIAKKNATSGYDRKLWNHSYPWLAITAKKKKIYLFTALTVQVSQKSLYQNKVDDLQKLIPG